MKIIKKIKTIQNYISKLKKEQKSIGFVPAMGALHKGHLSLIKRARKENDIVVVSIFVNPKQFGPDEDYLRYPRPFKKDKCLCKKEKVDILFSPSVEEMYPSKSTQYLTYVNVENMSEQLCGKFRPGHFRGVSTVVTKLFNIVQPDKAYFGQKDYQQLKIIQKLISDLNFDIKIIPCAIIREKDGLAMSSRNTYLNESERKKVNQIYWSLKLARNLIKENIKSRKIFYVEDILKMLKEKLSKILDTKIDYITICDANNLNKLKGEIVYKKNLFWLKNISVKELRILVGLWIGKTRLIDNMEVKVKINDRK